MTTFKSTERIVRAARSKVYRRLSDPANFQKATDGLPEELKHQAGDIRVDGDTITLNAKSVGDISFRMERGVENERVHLASISSPLPFGIDILLADGSESETTNAHVEISIDLNPIIKSMLAKPMQMVAEKFADLIATLPYEE